MKTDHRPLTTDQGEITPQELARLTVEKYIGEGEKPKPPAQPGELLSGQAGVFVTIRTTDGDLRGCVGTILPVEETIAREIIENAISAATRDPRFPPVSRPELSRLTYGVDILLPPEPVTGPEQLDPALYGVIVETLDRSRRGLLLPRIDGIETVEQQWRAVHQKAGIPLGAPVRAQRFTVNRYGKD